jgi:hypothetical protein
MEAVFWPVVGLVFVGVLPGLLIEQILFPGRPALDRLALAPTISCAAVFLFFRLAGAVGVSVSPAAFVSFLVLIAAKAGVATRRRPAPKSPPSPPTSERRVAVGMLIVAVGVGGAIWLNGIPNQLSVPPNHDSMNHAFMAARIADTGSLDPDSVLVTDVRSREAVTAFYPLGLHVVAALVHGITGSNFSDILWWIVVLSGAVCLPAGMFALARRFFPQEPLAAGAAAMLSVLIPLFPYKPIAWGGIALILGMALTPGVVVALEASVTARWSFGPAALGVIALLGILVVHTSEIPLAVLLVGTLVLHQAPRPGWWRFVLRHALRLAAVGTAFAAAALPVAGHAMEDRTLPDNPTLPLGLALSEILRLRVSVDVGQARVALLAAAGLAILLWRRRPWLVAAFGVLVTIYFIAASSTNQPLRTLASPWYKQSERVAYVVAMVAAIPAGLAVASAARAVGRWSRGPRMGAIAMTSVVVLASVGAALSIPGPTSDMLVRTINAYSAVGDEQLAAFRFVEQQGSSLGVLGDEMGDGSIWMYPLASVSPAFGMKPPSDSNLFKTWQEKVFLAEHLGNTTDQQKVGALLAKYCIGFVYYTDRHLYGATDVLDLQGLETSSRLTEAFRSGNTRIFRVKDAQCAQDSEKRPEES